MCFKSAHHFRLRFRKRGLRLATAYKPFRFCISSMATSSSVDVADVARRLEVVENDLHTVGLLAANAAKGHGKEGSCSPLALGVL